MNNLKERFGKFALAPEKMMETLGGHCPRGISEGWCSSYWVSRNNSDSMAYLSCVSTCRGCGACK